MICYTAKHRLGDILLNVISYRKNWVCCSCDSRLKRPKLFSNIGLDLGYFELQNKVASQQFSFMTVCVKEKNFISEASSETVNSLPVRSM